MKRTNDEAMETEGVIHAGFDIATTSLSQMVPHTARSELRTRSKSNSCHAHRGTSPFFDQSRAAAPRAISRSSSRKKSRSCAALPNLRLPSYRWTSNLFALTTC